MIPFIMRQATLQDLDRIMEMENSIFASEAFSRRQYRHLLQSATCRILLCESGADLAAMVVTGWRARTGHLWIYSIAVSEQMRGQGLGKRMLEVCLEIARELKKPWIVLEVRVSNETAIRLYHQFGFDYLRDNMVADLSLCVQLEYAAAPVFDERAVEVFAQVNQQELLQKLPSRARVHQATVQQSVIRSGMRTDFHPPAITAQIANRREHQSAASAASVP